MKTKALEDLIEHCKHIGGIPAMFMKDLIIEAEAELKAINPHDPATLCRICGRPEYSHSPQGHDYKAKGKEG